MEGRAAFGQRTINCKVASRQGATVLVENPLVLIRYQYRRGIEPG